MDAQLFYEDNGDGWLLEIRRYVDRTRLRPDTQPIVLIPGYCMNTFVLGYHPSDLSIAEYLAQQGFEVWTANLRGQGGSVRQGGSRSFGFRELALVDLPAVFQRVLRSTQTERDSVTAIGCSLGASFLYIYLAFHREEHCVGSVVSLGGPIRWVRAHPLVRLAFQSPTLASRLPIRGTRRLARRALPILQRTPWILSIYMNPDLIDLSSADELVKTVDDPVPQLNGEIANWIKQKDLIVDRVNVCDALRGIEIPTLCVVANRDGIVPVETALALGDYVRPESFAVLHVGDDERWFAHADLFISEWASRWVFEPLCDWLNEPRPGKIVPQHPAP